VFKEKIIHCATPIYSGRGIWRCLFDPSSLLLVTAGFDSAIKVHRLRDSIFHDKAENKVVCNSLNYDSEVFVLSSPSVLGQCGPLDRCDVLLYGSTIYIISYISISHVVTMKLFIHWLITAKASMFVVYTLEKKMFSMLPQIMDICIMLNSLT